MGAVKGEPDACQGVPKVHGARGSAQRPAILRHGLEDTEQYVLSPAHALE